MEVSLDELRCGCAAFWKNERRDAMYRVAIRLVDAGWGNPAEVADGIGVILLTWNQAAYRYGSFDFFELERFLRQNQKTLNGLRGRQIQTFQVRTDSAMVESLFSDALNALAFTDEKRKTPVGVAKALHMISPTFFPLWDKEIAKKCQCNWHTPDNAAAKYIAFIENAQTIVASLERQFVDEAARSKALSVSSNLVAHLSQLAGRPKTMLKFLDEYFYAKYTKAWI